jgi:bifunctional non-homologous end joining protein LigD
MTRFDNGQSSLITRGGHDWSDKMPQLIEELKQLGVRSGWLDGEIVVLGDNGTPSFNALQNSFDRRTSAVGISYFVFDVPYFEGYDLRGVPLIDRRKVLKALLDEKATEHVRFSADFPGDAANVLGSACRMGLEGVIAKRADAPYASRRTDSWLKLKCKLRQEFVVCGYTDRTDGSPQVGSLLLGVYADNGDLVSAGSVGTGWSSSAAAELKKKLVKLEVPKPPFTAGAAKPGRWSKRASGTERWLEPRIVAEVEFAEWTPDGNVRHASFVALRTDKPAKAIRREVATAPADAAPRSATPTARVRSRSRTASV